MTNKIIREKIDYRDIVSTINILTCYATLERTGDSPTLKTLDIFY